MYKGGNLCSKDCNSNQKSIQKSQCIGYILMILANRRHNYSKNKKGDQDETNNKEFTFQAIAWRMYRNYCGTFGRGRLDEHYRNR